MNRHILHIGARAHNKHLTDEFLNKLDYEGLLRFQHPLQRGAYAWKLHREGKISYDTARQFIKID